MPQLKTVLVGLGVIAFVIDINIRVTGQTFDSLLQLTLYYVVLWPPCKREQEEEMLNPDQWIELW